MYDSFVLTTSGEIAPGLPSGGEPFRTSGTVTGGCLVTVVTSSTCGTKDKFTRISILPVPTSTNCKQQ